MFHNQTSEPILDTYGHPVPVGGSRKRLTPCVCEVPCLGFRCLDKKHTGSLLVPWCLGAAPETECNVCWGKRSAMTNQRKSMTVASLTECVEAAGATMLGKLLVNNLGFILAAAPNGVASWKVVNADTNKVRTELPKLLREFADKLESGAIPVTVQKVG